MAITYEVCQGDSVAQLAALYGFFPDTIWSHPDNAALKSLRGHMNILLPGDVVTIPEKTPKQLSAATGLRHVFRRRGVPAIFRLQVKNAGEPRANEAYQLTVDGCLYDGKTDGEGRIRQFVNPGASRVQLVMGEDTFTFRIGTMDPISTPSGVRKRLRNLGYKVVDEDASLAQAVSAFQKANGLDVTGKVDDKTRAKLAEVHDRV